MKSVRRNSVHSSLFLLALCLFFYSSVSQIAFLACVDPPTDFTGDGECVDAPNQGPSNYSLIEGNSFSLFTKYTPGQVHNLILIEAGGADFESFLIYAKDKNGNYTGDMIPLDDSSENGPCGTNSSLTQTVTNPPHPFVHFSWNAPEQDVGPITFEGIIVENQNQGQCQWYTFSMVVNGGLGNSTTNSTSNSTNSTSTTTSTTGSVVTSSTTTATTVVISPPRTTSTSTTTASSTTGRGSTSTTASSTATATATSTATVTATTTSRSSTTTTSSTSGTMSSTGSSTLSSTTTLGVKNAETLVSATVEGNPSTFNTNSFLNTVAAVISIPSTDVVLVNMTSGSVIVNFHIRSYTQSQSLALAETLVQKKNDTLFTMNGFTIDSITIVNAPTPDDSPASSLCVSFVISSFLFLVFLLFLHL